MSGGAKRKKTSTKVIELAEEQKRDIKEAFKLFDTQASDNINTKDLQVAMKTLGFEPQEEEIAKLIAVLDEDNSGKIALEKFIEVMSVKISEKDANEEVMKVFKLFDDDDTGLITLTNLTRVAKELGEKLTDEDLQEMIDVAPTIL